MNGRILVVALNPALDLTYELPRVDWAGVNRPVTVSSRPGGKGINVARTLHALGADVLVMGLAGELTGQAVVRAGREPACRGAFTEIAGETRRTLAVIDRDRGQTALFNEPGPRVSRCRVRGVPGPVSGRAGRGHGRRADRKPAAGPGGRQLRGADRDRGARRRARRARRGRRAAAARPGGESGGGQAEPGRALRRGRPPADRRGRHRPRGGRGRGSTSSGRPERRRSWSRSAPAGCWR